MDIAGSLIKAAILRMKAVWLLQISIAFLSSLLTLPVLFYTIFQGGVQRVHLLDGTIGGVLLLELFKRDGMGTMVARYVIVCYNL